VSSHAPEHQGSIYARRAALLRGAMIDEGVDALILTPGPDMLYLTGFSEEAHERLLCLVVSQHAQSVFVCPSLNAEQVLLNPAGVTDIRDWADATGWHAAFHQVAGELELAGATIAVGDDLAARFLLPIQVMLPGVRFVGGGNLVALLRCVKDDEELRLLRRASEITEAACQAGIDACRVGVTEREVADVIERAITSAGATVSFDTIVAAGPNGALPHHRPGGRVLTHGDVVVLDLGATYENYRGDMTRTVAIGEASEEAQVVYDAVYRAGVAATAAVKPGAIPALVDAAARRTIELAGYGDYFIHRTGHGIGLAEHELPNIVDGNETPLEPGNCFSIEPGIYVPGQFGVRLENLVAVTDDGYESLNSPIPERIPVV